MLQRQEASILQLIQEIEELVLELTTKQKLKNSRYMYFQIHEIREKIQTDPCCQFRTVKLGRF